MADSCWECRIFPINIQLAIGIAIGIEKQCGTETRATRCLGERQVRTYPGTICFIAIGIGIGIEFRDSVQIELFLSQCHIVSIAIPIAIAIPIRTSIPEEPMKLLDSRQVNSYLPLALNCWADPMVPALSPLSPDQVSSMWLAPTLVKLFGYSPEEFSGLVGFPCSQLAI